MSWDVLQSQKDDAFCDARLLTPSEKASMERATAEAHGAFDVLLRDRPSEFWARRDRGRQRNLAFAG
jgi:hypothetical protein